MGRLTLVVILLVTTLVACGSGSAESNQGDNATEFPTEVPATSSGLETDASAMASTGDIAQVEPTGTASLPEGFYIATPGEDDVQRDEPEPTAGPPPTQPPPIRSNFDSDGDGFYAPDEFVQAISALYPSYIWPDQYYVSLDEIIERIQPMVQPGMRQEVPGEYTVIGRWNQCAWGLSFLDAFAAGDDVMMAGSLVQLRWNLEINPLTPPETITNRRERYDRAELGDVADLQNWVTVNCDASDFSLRPAGTPSADGHRHVRQEG